MRYRQAILESSRLLMPQSSSSAEHTSGVVAWYWTGDRRFLAVHIILANSSKSPDNKQPCGSARKMLSPFTGW